MCVCVGGGAHSAEFARYWLLGRDVTYCGTDLLTFRCNLLASSSLVEIYRPLEARSVSRFNYHEYVVLLCPPGRRKRIYVQNINK